MRIRIRIIKSRIRIRLDIYGKCPEICTGMPGEDIKINLDFLILGKHNYIF